MASAWFYCAVAANLDELAAELDDCATSGLAAGDSLRTVLDCPVTELLQSEYHTAAAGAHRGAGALRSAADWARAEAVRAEAVEAAAAFEASVVTEVDAGFASDSALLFF